MWISTPLVGHAKGTLHESTEQRETAASIVGEVEPPRSGNRDWRLTQGSSFPALLSPPPQKSKVPPATWHLYTPLLAPDSPVLEGVR